jgi:hypothetical protein
MATVQQLIDTFHSLHSNLYHFLTDICYFVKYVNDHKFHVKLKFEYNNNNNIIIGNFHIKQLSKEFTIKYIYFK